MRPSPIRSWSHDQCSGPRLQFGLYPARVIGFRRMAWVGLACLAVACSPTSAGSPAATPGTAEPSPTEHSPTVPPSPTVQSSPTPTPAPTVPGDALLPDLVMEPLADWDVEYENDRRLLHVTTIFSNVGEGPFELKGSRLSLDASRMTMDQVVYSSSGESTSFPNRVNGQYAGDGHNHWHARQVVTMQLAPILEPRNIRLGNKIDFCFFDNSSTHPDVAGAVAESYYQNQWCGQPDSLSVRMGLSIGWGDRYGWDFVGQYIDITAVPGGTYTLRATVDWADEFFETDDTNNCTMSRIQIPAAGSGRIITVEATNQPC